MQKNFVCLICGEKISLQIDLNKLTISTDCKNRHHFRDMPFVEYYKFLPNSNINKQNLKNKYIFYCFVCQENINLSNIEQHNGHDGIKLSMDEFLSKTDYIEFKRSKINSNFNKELNKIEKIIKDFTEWKIKFDKKFNLVMQFLEKLYILEKNTFNDIIKQKINEENSIEYYNYETLINIKEIYRINSEISNYSKNYEGLFNSINFNKLSYFIMNKMKDINEQHDIIFKDINIYYQNNKCFFNEEIKYKKERKDNLFPLIKKLFTDCKHLLGYDIRYFDENPINKNLIKLNNTILHQLLLKIKNKYPKINHISHMRNKSYLLCCIQNNIIIIKTNIFSIQNEKDLQVKEIATINYLSYHDLSNISFSLELTNGLLLAISANYIYIYETYKNEENNDDEDDYYKNYFLKKKFQIKKPIDDIMQVSSKLFVTYSYVLMRITFYDIKYMEIVTNIGGIEGTIGNNRYFTMVNDSLLFAGTESIFIISVKEMEIKAEIKTSGLISSFCLLPNNGLLCGEFIIDYTPNSPWKKGDNQYYLVQYQIGDNEIKKISTKNMAHTDTIKSLFYLENNIILSCSIKDELKLWY